ncbi:MAG: hypothetical protein U5O15_06615 [Candidatus Krumholzibacteriota bacterium]|nr:hypothetical protein [Candidatus Krumholzibacteriota bacterium]
MLKNRLVFLVLVVMAALFIVGCGDDDEVAGPTSGPATFTNGEIYTYSGNGLYFGVYMHVQGGGYPDIDSIKVDTALVDVDESYWWSYADPYWYAYYYEGKDPSDYESGDSVRVSMYGSGLSSSCNIKILDYDDDEPEIITPASGTTVDTSATVKVVWNKVENAEYYAIRTELYTGSWEYNNTYTRDTTYTVPAEFTGENVDYFYVYVLSTCGPDPANYNGNWTGELTNGYLYSHSGYDYTRVYVDPTVTAKVKSVGKEDDAAPNVTPREIIQGLYGLNR